MKHKISSRNIPLSAAPAAATLLVECQLTADGRSKLVGRYTWDGDVDNPVGQMLFGDSTTPEDRKN